MRAVIRLTMCLAAIAPALVPAATALAEIKILKANQSPVPAATVSVTFNPATGGWDVVILSLYAPYGDSVYEIHGNAGETIDNLYIGPDGPPAGSPLTVKVLSDAPGGITDLKNVLQVGTAETILAKVNVAQDIGSIQCEVIGDITAGRDIIGPIIATSMDNPMRGIGNAWAGRHILGDLVAEHGRILVAWAQSGNIGTVLDPVLIRSKYHTYQVMGDAVYADINTRADNNSGNGGFWALVANKFFGSLNTGYFFFNSSNSVDGLVVVYQQFQANITIGGPFTSPTQYIQVPIAGLNGQIIINGDNAPAPPGGAWTAPVRIGPNGNPNQIVLTGPNYPQTAAMLGGGSVGMVPFHLHDQASAPANGGTANVLPNGPPLSVALRHRGPIDWAGGVPLTIDRRQAGTQNAFVPVPLTDFTANPEPNNPNGLIVTAAPLKPGFLPGYQYRIKPAAALKSDVPAQPTVVWDSDYLITVLVPPCDGDVTTDGTVNINDLLMVINFWGPVNPVYPAPDMNHDGLVNIDDLLKVISNWGPCWQ